MHEFSGPRRERAVNHLGVKTAQILADQGSGITLVAEFGEQPIDSAPEPLDAASNIGCGR